MIPLQYVLSRFSVKLLLSDCVARCSRMVALRKVVILQILQTLSDCNGTRTRKHLVRKRTLGHVQKMT